MSYILSLSVILTVACGYIQAANVDAKHEKALPIHGDRSMKTKIAVLGSPEAAQALLSSNKPDQMVVDPTSILENSRNGRVNVDDIEEDANDRFITTRSGKRRASYVDEADADEWAEDTVVNGMDASQDDALPPTLSGLGRRRVKRCNNNDNNANRARRARRNRARRTQRTRSGNNQASKTTTVVTRRVIQNGQVISETTENRGQAGSAAVATAPVVVQHQQQPVVVQHQQQPQSVVYHQPVVQGVQQHPAAPVVVQSAAPGVVQQQPIAAAPVIQQQQQPAANVQTMPSISVQGSIKVN